MSHEQHERHRLATAPDGPTNRLSQTPEHAGNFGRMRRLAFALTSASVVAAVYVHGRKHEAPCHGWLGADKPMCAYRSSWQDPTAALLVIAGFVIAAAVVAWSRRGGAH